jgi:hypothetical protein
MTTGTAPTIPPHSAKLTTGEQTLKKEIKPVLPL